MFGRPTSAWVASMRPAAEKGYPEAQFQLGLTYHLGQGVAKDDREAVRWFGLAAEQGLAEAQFLLGVSYYRGEGVAKDRLRAYLWLNISAAQGLEKASKGRESIAKEMTRAEIAEAQRLSREWRPKEKSQ